jgi:hypothetical protein
MKQMIKSKKGYKTIVTIFSLLFIAIAFVFFSYLFKNIGKDDVAVASQFKSIDTEYALRTFLASPSGIEPEELKVYVGDHMSNAQIAARTCTEQNTREYETLKENARIYFNKLYGDNNWRLELIYVKNSETNPEITGDSVGELDIDSALDIYESYEKFRTLTDDSELSRKRVLYALNIRGSRLGMQILPCNNDNSIVKLVLVNNLGEKEVAVITVGSA